MPTADKTATHVLLVISNWSENWAKTHQKGTTVL